MCIFPFSYFAFFLSIFCQLCYRVCVCLLNTTSKRYINVISGWHLNLADFELNSVSSETTGKTFGHAILHFLKCWKLYATFEHVVGHVQNNPRATPSDEIGSRGEGDKPHNYLFSHLMEHMKSLDIQMEIVFP